MFTPDEILATQNRFAKTHARTLRDQGGGATVGGLALTKAYVPAVAEAIRQTLKSQPRRRRRDDVVAAMVKGLDPETMAVCLLQSVLHSIAMEAKLVSIYKSIGKTIHSELWADGLREHDAKLAKKIEKVVVEKHGSLTYRLQAARAIATRAGYNPSARWNTEQLIAIGQYFLNILLKALPECFEWVILSGGGERGLTVSDSALAIVEKVQLEAMRMNPVFLPSAEPSVPWTDWTKGGPTDPRMQRSTSLIRSFRQSTAALVKASIRSGEMQPAIDALNAIQATPWRINSRVLEVQKFCVANHIDVPGLPLVNDYAAPAKDKPWDDMTTNERTVWKFKAAEVEKANRSLKADRLLVAEDVETATQMAALPRFWTPYNMDWRGRVYALPYFNFQREDKVRGLFEFADGEPITEEGLYWLKIHTANCGDFNKVSKRPFEERLKWVDDNLNAIIAVAEDPVGTSALGVWTKADAPFLFLAACLELSAAVKVGAGYVSHLPVNWDGSCSGLQHLCAATRSPEGSYVNLTPQEIPADVYQRVADEVNAELLQDSICGDPITEGLAKQCLNHGIDRSVAKRNVMTFCYGSKKFGMAEQQRTDLMDPLKLKVLTGELEEHPFGPDNGFAASKYLAAKVYAAIERTVAGPVEAMAFLQSLARTMAHEGKPLMWTSPVGIPCENRYHEPVLSRVKLWLYDRGVEVDYRLSVADGETKPIAKDKAANGIAANFTHSLDAAHLLRTVKAAASEGFGHFALVHDSFGCHASRAARFHQIIREEFVRMYEEHDVLQEVLDRATADLTEHNHNRLPSALDKGALNIHEVLDAKYAFA